MGTSVSPCQHVAQRGEARRAAADHRHATRRDGHVPERARVDSGQDDAQTEPRIGREVGWLRDDDRCFQSTV